MPRMVYFDDKGRRSEDPTPWTLGYVQDITLTLSRMCGAAVWLGCYWVNSTFGNTPEKLYFGI